VDITPFEVIQGHRVWYQSKARMRLPSSHRFRDTIQIIQPSISPQSLYLATSLAFNPPTDYGGVGTISENILMSTDGQCTKWRRN